MAGGNKNFSLQDGQSGQSASTKCNSPCRLYEGNKGIATIGLETTVRMKFLSMEMFIQSFEYISDILSLVEPSHKGFICALFQRQGRKTNYQGW